MIFFFQILEFIRNKKDYIYIYIYFILFFLNLKKEFTTKKNVEFEYSLLQNGVQFIDLNHYGTLKVK